MTEVDFQRAVLDLCQLRGVLVSHFRPARSAAGWRTPVAADGAGFPDLVIVGRAGVLFRELKTGTGRVSAGQRDWLAALEAAGADAAIWRPADLLSGRVDRELRALAVMAGG